MFKRRYASAAALMLLSCMAGTMTGAEWEVVAIPDEAEVKSLAMDGSIVWMATLHDGLIGYDGSEWVSHTVSNSELRNDSWNYTVFVDSQRRKWVARDTWETIDRLDDNGTFADPSDDTWVHYSYPDDLGNYRVFSIAEDSNGDMWFGMRDENDLRLGVVDFLHETADTSEWFHFDNEWPWYTTNFQDDDVRALAVDGLDRLWIGYYAAGVDCWDYGGYESIADTSYAGDSWTHFSDSNGLPSNMVHALHVDSAGTVWVGTLGGLARYDPGEDSWMTVAGLPGVQARGIDSDAQGHIWVGTERGVAMLYSNGITAVTYGVGDGISDEGIEHIGVDRSSGDVWCVSYDESADEYSLNLHHSGFGPGTGSIYLYPNPWKEGRSDGMVSIFGAPEGSTVDVYDLAGELVRELEATQPYVWDSLDSRDNKVPSGVYIVKIETPDGRRVFLKAAIVR